MKKLLFLLLILSSCSKGEDTLVKPEPMTVHYFLEDGFEVENGDFFELFASDRWFSLSMTNPNNGSNEIRLDSNTVLSGNSALRVLARPSDDALSSMAIKSIGLGGLVESKIIIKASFYIPGSMDIEGLTLINLESSSCLDPGGSILTDVGVRLKIENTDMLSIDRSEILGSTITQNTFSFPRNEWVSVVWKMTLSPDDDGENILFINNQEVINSNGMNFPNAGLFLIEFNADEIPCMLNYQYPVIYESLRIGITDNPTENDVEVFVDDVEITVFR